MKLKKLKKQSVDYTKFNSEDFVKHYYEKRLSHYSLPIEKQYKEAMIENVECMGMTPKEASEEAYYYLIKSQ